MCSAIRLGGCRWVIRARPARRFAGGWAAFTDAVAGAYLVAVGVGAEPEGLPLAVLLNGSAYHFELDQPLASEVRSNSARAADILAEEPSWLRRDWHADHLRVMRELGDHIAG
ncbi:MAG: hypothetical protein ACRDOK_19055 [Streptosporangiaceae bacterium]